ncbi:IS3 family transposase [Numidum massiliense]|uniref:IS3 family transposase n=1 Tax=Numidum massiliense TaxID=1522315 RepID=UPI001E3696B5|nr:IS3 family transposase [Numidum massiliense]
MQTVLRIVHVPRSTYYYQKHYRVKEKKVSGGRPAPGYSFTNSGQKVSDEQIKEWLMELVSGDGYAYGYRKLTVALRSTYDLVINKKKVYRLCKRLGILLPQRRKRIRHPRRLARNRLVERSNELWETDIKYGYIAGENRFFFLLSYIDVYDRSIIDYHVGLACEGQDAVQVLQRALSTRGLQEAQEKPIIRTDNGPQFVSKVFEEACEHYGCEHERIPPNTPNKNAHIEAFHRIVEDECFNKYSFETYEEAYRTVIGFMDFYNNRRIHGSIGDMSPAQFFHAHQTSSLRTKAVRL